MVINQIFSFESVILHHIVTIQTITNKAIFYSLTFYEAPTQPLDPPYALSWYGWNGSYFTMAGGTKYSHSAQNPNRAKKNIARIGNTAHVTLWLSVTLIVMILVSQFVRNSQLWHLVAPNAFVFISVSASDLITTCLETFDRYRRVRNPFLNFFITVRWSRNWSGLR